MAAATPEFNPASVDAEDFARELRALRAEVEASLGEADAAHLRRIGRGRWWRWVVGLACRARMA